MLLFFFFAAAVFSHPSLNFLPKKKTPSSRFFCESKKAFGSFVGGKPVEVLFFIRPLNFPITQPQATACLEKHVDVDWVNDGSCANSDGSI